MSQKEIYKCIYVCYNVTVKGRGMSPCVKQKGEKAMINIGKSRECFFDNYLIDTMRTTAEARIHRPQRRELVFRNDAPWEGCGSDFHNFFYDEEYGKYRMYYLGWKMNEY